MEYNNVFEMLRDFLDKGWEYDTPLIGKSDIGEILSMYDRLEKIKELLYQKSWTEYDDTHGVVMSILAPVEEVRSILGELNG